MAGFAEYSRQTLRIQLIELFNFLLRIIDNQFF